MHVMIGKSKDSNYEFGAFAILQFKKQAQNIEAYYIGIPMDAQGD